MHSPRNMLSPDALAMLLCIAEEGSFAKAARKLKLVPSTLTYRVRQLEEALDVLLFDRSARNARPTPAGQALLIEAQTLLDSLESVAHRVKRVASGWEAVFTVAVDGVIERSAVLDLCQAFLALKAPTQLRLRDETLSGTLHALTSGQADLCIGVSRPAAAPAGLHWEPLGTVDFVYAVAPHHPLAQAQKPLSARQLAAHRAVAVADSVQRGAGLTIGLENGQEVFTVPTMQAKLQAQLRGLGAGFLPQPLAEPYIARGELIAKNTQHPKRQAELFCTWMELADPCEARARAWWTTQLRLARTKKALLGQLPLSTTSPSSRSSSSSPPIAKTLCRP